MKNLYNLRKPLLAAAAILGAVSLNAQILFDNGPISNSAGTGAGGADESVLYTTTFGMSTIGFGHQGNLYNRIADDFVNPNCVWVIDSIVFFGYQTGSTTTSTFTGVTLRIWDSIPDAVGSNVVYGDTTTNRLTRSVWSGVYRITETTTGATNRPIMRNVCTTPGLQVQAGTFWIDWASTGSLASGPWAPARTPLNQNITGNGRQRIGSVWNNALDGGTGTPQQGFPFIIYGTIIQPSASAGLDISFCSGDSSAIGGSPSGSGGNAPLTYSWSNATELSSGTATNPIASPTTTTTFVLTVTDALSCVDMDTVVVTVLQPSANTLAPTVCNSYLSPAGNTYATSGTYMDTLVNAIGCDSVITINLTVNVATSSTINPSACYSYMSPAGNTYTASGTYTDVIPNMAGCDSTITINLTINGTTTASISPVACYSYTSPSGMLLTASGTYMDTIVNMNGCDSVITINLTINTVDTSITMTGVILTANASGATYQWLNCDSAMAPVVGETGQSFMPLQDGNYAVVVTQNSCVDTSGCIMVIGTGLSAVDAMNVQLFPNPTSGAFTMNFGNVQSAISVVIKDAHGRTVYTQSASGVSSLQVDPMLEAGTYFVTINTDGQTAVKRLVVE